MVYFNLKKILFILLILMFLCGSFSSVYAVATNRSNELNVDSVSVVMSEYESVCADFVQRLSKSPDDPVASEIISFLENNRYVYYIEYSNIQDSQNFNYGNKGVMKIYLYSVGSASSRLTTDVGPNPSYYSTYTMVTMVKPSSYSYYTCTANWNGVYNWSLVANNQTAPLSDPTFPIPYLLYNYHSPYVTSWLLDKSSTNANNIVSAVQDLKDSLTNTQPSSDDDNTISSIDTNTGVNDTTDAGFTWIFNKFYNSITEEPRGIEVPIPFANTSFTIDPNATRNALGNNSWIITTLSSFWYFLVGLFIYKDMQKLIQKIQNGSIGQSTDTNIKADML